MIILWFGALPSLLMADNQNFISLKDELNLVKTSIKSVCLSMQAFDDFYDFEKEALQRIELSLRALENGLYTESYYNLSLYMVAKENFRYALALNAIKAEIATQNYVPLLKWLKEKQQQLTSCIKEKKKIKFNIDKEFDELIDLLSS